jgi:uncharacterized membrane protein
MNATSEQGIQDFVGTQIVADARSRQEAVELLGNAYDGRSRNWQFLLIFVAAFVFGYLLQPNILDESWQQSALIGAICGAAALGWEALCEARSTRRRLNAALMLIANGDLEALKTAIR